jgi:23S rRNA (uracil1939-C5)-methyltransferase
MKKAFKRNLPLLENVRITGIAAEGKAIARVNDMVVFVPYGATGDLVDIQVMRKKKSYMEGEIVHFHERSTLRTDPFCEHYGLCGGCKWQHLPYQVQAGFKQQQVVDSLERIGGFKGVQVKPLVISELDRHYRNKLEFTFTSRRWLTRAELPDDGERPEVDFNGLGFHLPGQYDRILDIHNCYLQPEPSNQIRLFVKAQALELGIPFYNIRQHEGVLRNIIIRNNRSGDFMVIIVTAAADHRTETLLGRMAQAFPMITSLHFVINDKHNDDLSDRDVICFMGDPWLMDEMDGLRFRIGPKSFYQTNANQVIHLYRKAVEFASLTGVETVYDLYTGTGTIANFVARQSQKVVGIEYVEQAISDAIENSRLNGITNTTFIAGDMAKVLTPEFAEKHGNPHVVITDPPRAGMHEDVVRQLMALSPERIVYVSCNPATQARDVAMMHERYEITGVQPVDMFPQTHHVENVIALERRDGIRQIQG